jgi:RNA 3'-terminal phosphate cyclase (ATP)
MDWQPRLWGRTRTNPLASTTLNNKKWVTHARHDRSGPHRQVERSADSLDIGAGGVVLAKEPGSKLITLDGSSGEGGGQILRSALSLSLLTGKPFRIVKIRANRDKPGLRPQHLKCVEAAAMLGNAEVSGGAIGSRDLTFRPGKLDPRDLRIDIGTAGATALLLHTLHLPLALRAEAPVRLTLTGGTYNESAPSFPFLETTWRAHMASIGMPVSVAMPTAGFYPAGGGTLEAWIEPATPRPLVLENRGELVKIQGMAETIRLQGVGRRMADRAMENLADCGFESDVEASEIPGVGPGASITLFAEFTQGPPVAFVGLGKRGKPAEAVADDAVSQLLEYLEANDGAVDLHSADQLLLPLAFANGRSVFTVTRVTEHLRTNVETIQAFLDAPIRVEEFDQSPGGRVIVG